MDTYCMDMFDELSLEEQPTGQVQSVTGPSAPVKEPVPLEERTTQLVAAVVRPEALVEEPESLTERTTQQVAAVVRPEVSLEELDLLAGWPTQLVPTVVQADALVEKREPLAVWPVQQLTVAAKQAPFTRELSRPIVTKKRSNRLLYGFSLLLIALVIAGIFLGPTVYSQVFTSKKPVAPNPNLQAALHPKTTIVHSAGVESTTHQFMDAMLQQNWSAMWSMLAPDAQGLWKNEAEFSNFEQAKFGLLTLQSYDLGQSVSTHPWLDPDTTQVYNSAVTVRVALQAFAPPDLLTEPSNSELNNGLFRNTLLALTQNAQGTWQVMVAGPADLDAPVLVPAKAPVTHVIIPIFMYHQVSHVPATQSEFNRTVTTVDFNKQLDWMQQQGYQSITMTELFASFYYGKALPPKPVIFTFDDGFTDVYTDALPALLAHHYRGEFYIPTALRGGIYMSWEQVRALANSGMEIASHTIHHASLDEFPYTQYKTTPQAEIVDSKATLEQILGTPIQFFCYPSGEPFHHGSDTARQKVLKYLFDAGYLGATLDPLVIDSALQNSSLPYQMPRIRVSGGETLDAFSKILKATLQQDAVRLHNLESSPTPQVP